jgi:ribosomal-protein-alanine N-acetyltransferase
MGSLLLETDRLRLCPLALDDADDLHRLWTDPGVRRYLWDGEAIPPEQTREIVLRSVELFEREGLGLWAVRPRERDGLIGFSGYWFFREPPELELLYGIAAEHWGRGYATEAARAMLRYGFERLGFDRVAASTDPPNAASIRVLEKLGMRFERRETIKGLGTVFYGITRDDLRS